MMPSLSSPLSVHFEITDSCNNYCSHCYGYSWTQQRKRARPAIIEVAQRIAECEVFEVVLTGGEPLLMGIDNLCNITEVLYKENIECFLNTNGRLLKKETCKLLKTSGLKNLLISLHSWDNELHDEIVNAPNAANETKIGIKNALNEGLNVTVNQVIDSRNIDTMLVSSKELEKLGVPQLSFTRMLSPLGVDFTFEMVQADRFIDEFIKCKQSLIIPIRSLLPIPFCADPRVKTLNQKMNCSGGISTAVISCYGDVRYCPHDTYNWGNVFKESISSIWKRISKWRDEISVPLQCSDCSFAIDCHGGCRVAAKLAFNDYKAKDPWANLPVKNYNRKVTFDEFQPECLYILLSDIRWRKENGAYLLYNNGNHMLVNFDGMKFLSGLPHTFIPNRLINLASPKKKTQVEYLRALYRHGLLAKGVNKETRVKAWQE